MEFGVKQKDEDAGSIKEGGDLDVKLNVINEKDEDGEDNDCAESRAVAVTALEMCAVTTGALKMDEMVKGDTTASDAEQHAKENEGSGAAATSGKQSGNVDDSVKVTAC